MPARTNPVAAQVNDLRAALMGGGLPDDAAGLIDLIRSLEDLKSTACAVQAEASVAFDAVRRSEQSAAGVPAARQGRGVVNEIALARRESPHRAQQLLGLGKVLHHEMFHTRERFAAGDLNEWRATLLARETACLTKEQRAFVDEELCADSATLAGLGTGEIVKRAKALTCEIDPAAVARRTSRAEADRRVSIRPAPDTMSYLTGHLPVAQGVAAFAALGKEAEALRAAGDPRGKGQLMADLLVARITGADVTPSENDEDGETPPPAVPITLNLTMSDEALLAGGHQPATVSADGVAPDVIPAAIARLLLARSLRAEVATWIRNLYLDHTGRLIAMSSRQRFFPDGLADHLAQRDAGICRTPYCDAPIRHTDHVTPVEAGGSTSAVNGQGLCETCNHAKNSPGWRQRSVADPGQRHGVETITPTGHRYRSHAPPPPGFREPRYIQTGPGVYTLVA